jgi:hypothetical protein
MTQQNSSLFSGELCSKEYIEENWKECVNSLIFSLEHKKDDNNYSISDNIIIYFILFIIIVIFIVFFLIIKYIELMNERINISLTNISNKSNDVNDSFNKHKTEQNLLIQQIFKKLCTFKTIKDEYNNNISVLTNNFKKIQNDDHKLLKNDINCTIEDFKDYIKIIVNYIDKKVDEKIKNINENRDNIELLNNKLKLLCDQKIEENNLLKLNKIIETIDVYFSFFLSFNIDKSVFHSLFYIKNEEIEELIGIDQEPVFQVLCKYLGKHYLNKFYPIKFLKCDNKKYSDDFVRYYGLKKNNIDELICNIKSEKINFIDFQLFEKNMFETNNNLNNFRLLNETEIEYELRLLDKVKVYFDKLYTIYQKYIYYGIDFDKEN